jgi:integrase/recombinase XerD
MIQKGARPGFVLTAAIRMLEAIDEYIAHLSVERGLAPTTLAAYQTDLVQFVRHHGERTAESAAVAPADIVEFLTALGEAGLVSASLARKLSALRGYFAYLVRERQLAASPAESVNAPRLARTLPETLTEEEADRLIATAGRDGDEGARGGAGDAGSPSGLARAIRDRALVELLYSCGLRVSEGIGLDLDDLDLERLQVRVRGKGGRERLVPFGRSAERDARRYLDRARPLLVSRLGEQAVFLNHRGGRLTRVSCFRLIRRAAREAGIGRSVSPHVLRHSFASHLLNRGADVRFVQELLGHASVSTTVIYTHLSMEKLFADYRRYHPRG